MPGMAVFKHREEGEPEKFIADRLDDFYHIGLYAGGNRVLEAKGTAYGFVESKLTSGWDYAGRIKGISYQKEGETMDALWTGKVTGGKLRMRNKPNGDYLRGIPDGNTVEVLQEVSDDWVYVLYDGTYGYVQRAYLMRIDADSGADATQDSTDMVTVTLSKTVAQELLAALQAAIL